MKTVRISVRLTREQYRALKILVEEGEYHSISDALREAIIKLVKDYSYLVRQE